MSDQPTEREYSSLLERDTTALQNEPRPFVQDAKVIDASSSPDRVTVVQAALHAAGYHCQIDGQYGRQTAAAVARFQADSKLKDSGVVNAATLRRLISKIID